MANMNNPGTGPLSGVPLRGKFRQILHETVRMNGPFRGASLAERPGAQQFDTGSGRVDIALVKHMYTPMGTGKTSGVYKGRSPCFLYLHPVRRIQVAGYEQGVGRVVQEV